MAEVPVEDLAPGMPFWMDDFHEWFDVKASPVEGKYGLWVDTLQGRRLRLDPRGWVPVNNEVCSKECWPRERCAAGPETYYAPPESPFLAEIFCTHHVPAGWEQVGGLALTGGKTL